MMSLYRRSHCNTAHVSKILASFSCFSNFSSVVWVKSRKNPIYYKKPNKYLWGGGGGWNRKKKTAFQSDRESTGYSSGGHGFEPRPDQLKSQSLSAPNPSTCYVFGRFSYLSRTHFRKFSLKILNPDFLTSA